MQKYSPLNDGCTLELRRFTLTKKNTLNMTYGRIDWYLLIFPHIHIYIYVGVESSLAYIYIYIYIHLSMYLSACLSACLSVCLSIYLSIRLSICLSIYWFIHLFSFTYITLQLNDMIVIHLECYSTIIDRKSCCRKRFWIREKGFAVWTWIDETT